jgi:hypothetical protein
MKDFLKKAIVLLASFMAFSMGEAAYCNSLENRIEDSQNDIWLPLETYFNTKISDYVTGKATFINLRHLYEADSFIDTNDWTSGNYTNRPPIAVNNFYVEIDKHNFLGGVGFKTFPERDGLVSALRDIEYQFFPVDAKDPLRMRWIGVPGVWGKLYFSPETYFRIVWYETLWSRISPETVPELENRKLEDPMGDQGYSLFTSFGTRVDDLSIEVGFTRAWASWPSEEKDITSQFSPNPYKLSAAYVKFRKYFDTWSYGGTALVKNCEENSGSILNSLFSIDKELSLWENPMSIGTSFFFVQSFEQSRHLRTSPWDDLGNSLAFYAHIEDNKRKERHGIEGVFNVEELGIYATLFSETWWVPGKFKIRSQMDFVWDEEKHISNKYDSVRIAGYIMFPL